MFQESTLSPAVRADEVVAEARRWLGVPFAHQGRAREGVDCAGLVFVVGWALGLTLEDVRAYSARPDGVSMKRNCDAMMNPIGFDQVRPGDVLLFRNGANQPQHLGIVGDHPSGGQSLIHAWERNKRVVEQRLDAVWLRLAVSAYRLRGVG
jgi:cell wall-associated NlpC family hydrolase